MGTHPIFESDFDCPTENSSMRYLSQIAKISLVNAATKSKVEFAQFHEEKPTVYFFIRRFGCILCRWGAKDIKRIIPIVGDRAHVIAIAPEWLGVDEFKNGNFWDSNLFIEETKEIYKLIGFKKYNPISVLGVIADSKVAAMNKQAKAEGISGNFSGDKLTTGGVVIVKNGKIILEFKQQSAGDHCPAGDILKALEIDPKLLENQNPIPNCDSEACSL